MRKQCHCGNDTFTFEEKNRQGTFGTVLGTYLVCTSCEKQYEIEATRTYGFKEATKNVRN